MSADSYFEPTALPFSEQRSDLRASVGKQVSERLESIPGVWRLTTAPGRPVQMYMRERFLSREECMQLCQQVNANAYPSPLYEKEKHEGVRTSHSCNLNVYDPLVWEIESRIADFLGIDRSFGEPLQGQRYEQGQQFKEHVDFFYIDQPYWAEYEPHGGQRTWTAMIYLSEPVRGGGTGFKFLDLLVEPKIGRILIWNNMAEDGSPNGWVNHSGEPVDEGVKYIVTKWYRERTFV
jgi:prolyl 4-hydroxylase